MKKNELFVFKDLNGDISEIYMAKKDFDDEKLMANFDKSVKPISNYSMINGYNDAVRDFFLERGLIEKVKYCFISIKE